MRQTHKEKNIRNKEICRMITGGRSLRDVAIHFGLSQGTIRHIYTRLKGKLPDKNGKRNQAIYESIVSGKSYQQVGNEFGITKERVRQLYLQLGGTISPFKTMKRQKIFERGLTIAKGFMKNKKYFPPYKEILQFLLRKNSSTYAKEIYEMLRKKYKSLPAYETVVEREKKKKLLNDLKRLHSKVRIPLSMSHHLKTYGLPSSKSYMYYFGSFKKACHLAGVPYGKRGGNVKERSRIINKSLK